MNGTNRLTFDVIDGGAFVYTNYPIFSKKAEFTTVGTHTIDLLSDGVGINQILYIYNNGAGNSATIDNVSVKEITDATNIPRIDYTDGTASILLEPQSTNLVTYSEDFSQWTTSNSTEIANNAISPSGGMNAYKLHPNSSGNYRNLTTGGQISGLNTFSIFAKAGELQHLVLIDYDGGGAGIDFNLSTGVATDVSTSGFDSFDMVDYGNGWYRCIATATNGFSYWILSDNGGVSVTANGTDGLYIWGAQTEALPYATSYIPTSGAIATRLADSVSGAGDATTFNSTEGVLYVEIAALANDLTNRTIALSDGTVSNTVRIQYLTVSNAIWATVTNVGAGGNQAILQYTSSDITINSKIALKYKENDFALWVDGVKVSTDTSGVTFSANTLNTLQLNRGNGAEALTGKVKSVITFDTALTDAELECLTTI